MEYLGYLSLGVALAGIGFRCYLSVKRANALETTAQSGNGPRSSAKARRSQQAALARRLLRYHLGLSAA